MTPESQLLITSVRIAVSGNPEPLCLDINWDSFLQLAQSHKICALAYDGLKKSGADLSPVPEAALATLHKACMQAIAHSVQMDALRCRLETGLQQRKVAHVFLKGAVLKYDYPVSSLRTMTDLDILVHTGDYPAIDELVLSLDGTPEDGDGNHHSFSFPGSLKVEFHPNLLHHDTPVGAQINPGWQYTRNSEDFCKELTEEGLYLNTVCHMANHMAMGGIGIRFVLDVWVHHHLRQKTVDRVFVEQELERFGLLDFARNIEALADHWFSCRTDAPFPEALAEYIITSGSYGTMERSVITAASLSKCGSAASAFMRKAFCSRAEMEDRFHWLKGRPWLLPVAWFVRALRVVTRRSGLLKDWLQTSGAVSDAEIAAHRELLASFGIRRQKQ